MLPLRKDAITPPPVWRFHPFLTFNPSPSQVQLWRLGVQCLFFRTLSPDHIIVWSANIWSALWVCTYTFIVCMDAVRALCVQRTVGRGKQPRNFKLPLKQSVVSILLPATSNTLVSLLLCNAAWILCRITDQGPGHVGTTPCLLTLMENIKIHIADNSYWTYFS